MTEAEKKAAIKALENIAVHAANNGIIDAADFLNCIKEKIKKIEGEQ